MVTDEAGEALRIGVPSHTGDGRLWDGHQLYRFDRPPPRRDERRSLREAGVIIENRMDCCPGILRCGSLRVLDARARARLTGAGFVRFHDPDGHIQLWRSDDGRLLVLLAGEVSRPALPGRAPD